MHSHYIRALGGIYEALRVVWGTKTFRAPFRPSRLAFSLVEVVVSIGITSFCLITLLALFSVGITATRDSSEELQASHLAQSFIDTRRASPTNSISGFPVPPLPLSGQPATTNSIPVLLTADGEATTTPASALFGLNYRLTPASTAGQKTPVLIYLQFYWPAQASVANASGHYEVVTFLPAP